MVYKVGTDQAHTYHCQKIAHSRPALPNHPSHSQKNDAKVTVMKPQTKRQSRHPFGVPSGLHTEPESTACCKHFYCHAKHKAKQEDPGKP